MSLTRAIKHQHEHRRPYYGAGKHDPSCRPGGDCPYCQSNRRHARAQREDAANESLREWESTEDDDAVL